MPKLLPTGLSRLARMAGIAAIAGIVATGSATADTCGKVNGSWTSTFNNSVYDCDANEPAPNTGPTAECSYIVSAQACCAGGSAPAEEKSCICAVYNSNPSVFTAIGISSKKC